MSHWILDFVTHRPDLPILPGDQTRVGLGLWYSVAGTVLLEGAMFVAGLWLYLRSTEPLDRIGRWGLIGFVAFLLVAYAVSISGPPPPDARAVPWVALASWILPFWAGWFDRHRRSLVETPQSA